MALYKVEKYNKRTRFYKEELINLPNTISYWKINQSQCRKDKIKLKYVSKPSKNGSNREVVSVFVDFGDGEIWEFLSVQKKT